MTTRKKPSLSDITNRRAELERMLAALDRGDWAGALRPKPTYADIAKQLEYDPNTGLVTRIRDGYQGCINVAGYRVIRFSGQLYSVHRLAWLLTHGEWPNGEIDHINGDKSDNRLCNLRLATSGQNKVNRYRRNKTGFTGVTKHYRKFMATINVEGKSVYLGLFTTAEAAHAAYKAEARNLYGEFVRG